MAAIRLGDPAYVTKAPSWSHSMFKIGRLANQPGSVPKALRPYLLQKGEVAPIVSECRAKGKTGAAMVQCINIGVALKKGK